MPVQAVTAVPSGQAVVDVVLVQAVCITGHLVGSSGHTVAIWQAVMAATRVVEQMVGSAGHLVWILGQTVGCSGQKVTDPVPSGQIVAAPVALT